MFSSHSRPPRYSAFNLLRHALTGNRHWSRAWRNAAPKDGYDVIIIGGGGHGLATAYYLAKLHGAKRIAVVEKGWIGGGNTGRNTTIVRSDYLLEENSRLYECSLQLWEQLSDELNFNVMFSQRGTVLLAHNEAQLAGVAQLGNAMRLRGIDAELLSREELREFVPVLDCSSATRWPVVGGLLQPRGGTARHDAVAWGFARAADALGVDILENCEVTGIGTRAGRVTGVQTSRGWIGADKVGIAVAGHTSQVAAMAGLRLPIETHLLQAMVTEPVKPVLDTVIMAGAYDGYVSQTDKGEIIMGAELDMYPSYSQRGNLPRIEKIARYTLSLFPSFGKLRMMRCWAGINDMTMDGSPIIGTTPVHGLFVNGGWCYGGFKATPGSGYLFADLLASGKPNDILEPFALARFDNGRYIDEAGTGPVPFRH
ncbi:MAG: sarcosine oxidase subunit beta family protein [Woeseia sp.]